MRKDVLASNIEVLTLKDFLKVFNYDNFGLRACKIIKKEFKASLTAQLSKQKTIESAYRDQQIQKTSASLSP